MAKGFVSIKYSKLDGVWYSDYHIIYQGMGEEYLIPNLEQTQI